jgi:O-methyltransferase
MVVNRVQSLSMKHYARYLFGMLRAVLLFYKYRTRTMIPMGAYAENLAIMKVALARPGLKEGAVVECGTWKGGMAAGMIQIGGPGRRYYFFDSFEGLPPAKGIDGPRAKRWQADTSSPTYYGNCTASLEDFRHTLEMAGKTDAVEVHKGFFENTVPAFDCPPIAVLRLDADWYESTTICLEKFWNHVLPGGLILIDDYYDWDGCARAVHAFLATRQAPERIYQGPIGRVAFILKKDSLEE